MCPSDTDAATRALIWAVLSNIVRFAQVESEQIAELVYAMRPLTVPSGSTLIALLQNVFRCAQ